MQSKHTAWPMYGKLLKTLKLVACLLLLNMNAFSQAGANDPSFMSYTSGLSPNAASFNRISLLPSGKILASGGPKGLYRFNTDGTIDNTFNTAGLNFGSTDIAVAPDGTAYIGGGSSGLIHISVDGKVDNTFKPVDGSGNPLTALRIALQADGKLLVTSPSSDGLSTNIFRLLANGNTDASFTKGSLLRDDGNDFNAINGFSLQADGKILVYCGANSDLGNSIMYTVGTNPATIVTAVFRLNANGAIDPGFSTTLPSNVSLNVIKTLVQPGGIPDNNITVIHFGIIERLKPDGSVDNSFNSGTFAGGQVKDALLQPDGKVLVIGGFDTYNSTPVKNIVRINTNGSLDAGFNPGSGFDVTPTSVIRQADGNFVAAGSFTGYNGNPHIFLARVKTDGSNDPTFTSLGYGFSDPVNTLLVQPDGKIVVGGNFTTINGISSNRIARLNTDGTSESSTTFNTGTGFDNGVYALARQLDGKLLVGGSFLNYGSKKRNGFARLQSDGTLETLPGIGTADSEFIKTIVIRGGDNNIYIAGNFDSYNGVSGQNNIILVNTNNGLKNTSFTAPANLRILGGEVRTIALQDNSLATSKLYVGGFNLSLDGTTTANFFRLSSDGKEDKTFNGAGTGPDGNVNSIVVLSSGKVLIGGEFTNYNSTPSQGLALVDNTGKLITTGGFTGIDGQVFSIVLQSDGSVLVGGNFSSPKAKLVRFKSDGTLDASFDPGTGPDSQVNSVALQSDNKILVGGQFSNYNGTPRDNMARVLNSASCPTITLSPATTPAGVTGTAYSQTITATGGTGSYTFIVSTGTLPAGITLTSAGVLSGTPTAAASSTFEITATAGTCTGKMSYTLVVNNPACSTITVIPTTTPAATTGTAYSQTITATGGTGPYIFTVSTGALPAGITLTSAGVLSGTPTAAASSTFEITATAGTCTGKMSYTLVVNNPACPTITVSPTTTPAATTGTAYSQTITATGGTGPYIFTVSTGALPAGITLTSAGVLSGTPTAAASSTFEITATAGTCTGKMSYTLVVNNPACPTITVSPTTTPAATTGTAYSQTITATGGTGPYIFTVSTGALPAGITLTSAGVLSGTPTAAASSTFEITATAGTCTGKISYTLVVNNPACPTITVSQATIPAGTTGTAYSQTITATGGTGSYIFTVSTGTLPAGITLTSAGVLSGTPTAAASSTFDITATAGTCTGKMSYTLVVNNPSCPTITVSPATIPAGTTGTAYSQTITATGGTGPYTFTVSTGTLPAGITLTSAGVLSGTPTGTGSFPITITASSGTCSGMLDYTLVVNSPTCPTITFNLASLPGGTIALPYNQSITSTGGVSPFTYSITNGSLPIGISISTGGIISGTPTVEGNNNFTIQVADANDCKNTKDYTINIGNADCPKPIITSSSQNNYTQFILLSSSSSGNQWYKDGHAITDSTGAQYHVNSVGSYSVEVTSGACISMSLPYVVDVATAIEPIELSQNLRLFPNPAVDVLNVIYKTSSTKVAFLIINVFGTTLQTETPKINTDGLMESNIRIDKLSAGSYMLMVNEAGTLKVIKHFIKQ